MTPFDRPKLDALLDERGADVLLATSGHATQYLLGGYRFFLYDKLPALGLSRHLPVVGYVRERPDDAFYVGAGNEAWGLDAHPIWPEAHAVAWSSAEAAEHAARLLERRGLASATIAIEPPYLPAEALEALRRALPAARLIDGVELLEELRAIKSPDELELIRTSSRAVVDAMLATFAAVAPGDTKAAIVERLRGEQTARGLDFAYCLIAAGASHNRAPSQQVLREGDVLSLDSDASYRGYVADLTRMGVAGQPTARMRELLAEVDAVQAAARAVIAPGRRGGDIFTAAHERLAGTPSRQAMAFLAHGTGLLTHEAPRLTANGSPPYPAAHAERPLEPGMVLSVETHVADPEAGFIKLEDTIIVTADGHEPVGDHGRGWNALGR